MTRAYGGVKRLLLASAASELRAQFDAETSEVSAMSATADGREGIAAFLEKRAARFSGA